ncbi:DNA adenine methylase [Clostridium sporogenes]|uniref:DNA adenine methylase n=1 Tax=Clostridium sporogenes TaxID=1509 RepID=UPI0013D49A0C|nr:DNA adenine methylase [Clostridium sporogenes]NFG96872.1 DNA adenine methylase [Clostridium sporogenes]NFH33206.1 DNA adenine methylase [Clostridium sporogenes]NFL20209.1 DNA adenine methylase [Clostridium sporogenes]NFN71803.1 DNA adenine methylase [Clostridium sporogenes]NFV21956.1 DNA adenine methylase [Clostridium sporogenes]
MSLKKNFSPLRYPGGKNKLAQYTEKLIYKKNLNKSTYIEPFCGGAAVALYLLINGCVSNVIINDYDRAIYAFWYSVKNYSEELCNMIKNTEITIEEWHRQRAIQLEKEKKDLLMLGFSTLFLNRTNRSGILKAGVIGGMKQNGNYKLDCRFNKKQIIDKIKLIASYADKIEIYNLDTEKLIDDVIINLRKKSFIFFDPPYYKKGASLYTNFYKHEDHLALSNKIKNIKYHSWIVTYDNVKEIRDMYKDKRMETYQLNYYAQKKYKGNEVIFYSNTLNTDHVKQIKIVDNL